MKTPILLVLVLSAALFVLCFADSTLPPCNGGTSQNSQSSGKSACLTYACRQAFSFNILHFNDVYEAQTLGGVGGLAKVATLKKQLAVQAPTVAIFAGDIFSPSPLTKSTLPGSTATMDGQNMIAAMNLIPVDLSTFGNHETDLKVASFTNRMVQSNFTYGWVGTNALNQNYANLHKTVTFTVGPNNEYKIGVASMTIDSNNQTFESYYNQANSITQLASAVQTLRVQHCDLVIALTHLNFQVDQIVAASVPGIDIILGGHDHTAMHVTGGSPSVDIYKADANARSVWVHGFNVNYDGSYTRNSKLVPIDSSIPDDPTVLATVNQWLAIGNASFSSLGVNIFSNIGVLNETLDGLQLTVRYTDDRLTNVICLSYYRAAANLVSLGKLPATTAIDLVLFNGGAIRADDVFNIGQDITYYDALRISPFIDSLYVVSIRGDVLLTNLRTSRVQGSGQFMHFYPSVTYDNVASPQTANWFINGQPISSTKFYTLLSNDFVIVNSASTPLTFYQYQSNAAVMQILYAGNAAVNSYDDIRLAFINELVYLYGANH